jgi:hypothetical protein
MKAGQSRRNLYSHGATVLVILAAILFLSVGTLIYLGLRPPGSAFMIPGLAFKFPSAWRVWVDPLAGSLPTFVHTVAFVLLTAALYLPERRGAAYASVFWFCINSLLEIGQAAPMSVRIAELLPAWIYHVPVLDHTGVYFLRGTFDPRDLVAAALGAGTAYLLLQIIPGKETSYEN